jgi:hypothetical protein
MLRPSGIPRFNLPLLVALHKQSQEIKTIPVWGAGTSRQINQLLDFSEGSLVVELRY